MHGVQQPTKRGHGGPTRPPIIKTRSTANNSNLNGKTCNHVTDLKEVYRAQRLTLKEVIADGLDAAFEGVGVATALERETVASLVDDPVMKDRVGDDVL